MSRRKESKELSDFAREAQAALKKERLGSICRECVKAATYVLEYGIAGVQLHTASRKIDALCRNTAADWFGGLDDENDDRFSPVFAVAFYVEGALKAREKPEEAKRWLELVCWTLKEGRA